MKSILASLASFFLIATFSDYASGFHVSAAVIHTPNSATTVNGMKVRDEDSDTAVEISTSIQPPNSTSPADS
ncbi:hypothetical protein N8I77_005486 [Diaporthe amygdali]|uniref:Uncharacterized protein n=1 Tax=Phomopsis amygdali TaxID=1214568 RepID=A0AAD9SF52_PHOAM|nr:hypothetical protein N8I77_005486 [Diaporthe amygdali]